ncbi:MAG: prealbumin-like fold domain-containing protein, partial [Clostridium sp.]|uniref:prealbumin-like fold domain-containing protein n=1 Tax=Clostridium sp. TaxID=1506 RepID=UPI0025C2AE0A
VDEEGKFLANAEFTLYDLDGNVVQVKMTDENGVALFESIAYGNYLIKETKAPKGYLKEDTEIEVVVDSQKTQVFTFKNNKIKESKDDNASLGKEGLPSTGDAFDSRLILIMGLILVLVGSGLEVKRKAKFNK